MRFLVRGRGLGSAFRTRFFFGWFSLETFSTWPEESLLPSGRAKGSRRSTGQHCSVPCCVTFSGVSSKLRQTAPVSTWCTRLPGPPWRIPFACLAASSRFGSSAGSLFAWTRRRSKGCEWLFPGCWFLEQSRSHGPIHNLYHICDQVSVS